MSLIRTLGLRVGDCMRQAVASKKRQSTVGALNVGNILLDSRGQPDNKYVSPCCWIAAGCTCVRPFCWIAEGSKRETILLESRGLLK